MKKIIGMLIAVSVLGRTGTVIAASIYVSQNEATGSGMTGQVAADVLDDDWRNNFSVYPLFQTYTMAGTTSPIGSGFTHMVFGTSAEVVASLRNYTGGAMGQLQSNTATQPERNNGTSLPSGSPKPLSLSGTNYRNESSIGSTSSRNALLFEFTNLVDGFGLWLGDVETRSDGSGVLARIQLFDSSGSLLSSGGINPQSGTNQQLCGGSYIGCGNGTTRFVGFTDNLKQVKYMLIIVGEDDTTGNGNSEHMSFIGATIVITSGEVQTTGFIQTGIVSGNITGFVSLNTGGAITGSMSGTASGEAAGTGILSGEVLGSGNDIITGIIILTGDLIDSGVMLSGMLQTGTEEQSSGPQNLITDQNYSGSLETGYAGNYIITGAVLQTGMYSQTEVTGMDMGIVVTGGSDNQISVETGAQMVLVTTNQSDEYEIKDIYISNGTPYVQIPLPGDLSEYQKLKKKIAKRIIFRNKYVRKLILDLGKK